MYLILQIVLYVVLHFVDNLRCCQDISAVAVRHRSLVLRPLPLHNLAVVPFVHPFQLYNSSSLF